MSCLLLLIVIYYYHYRWECVRCVNRQRFNQILCMNKIGKQRVATNQMIKCPPINFTMKWKAMMAHDTVASTNTHTRLLSVFIGNKK